MSGAVNIVAKNKTNNKQKNHTPNLEHEFIKIS